MTLGGIFYNKLQIRGIPNIAPPIISVSANYPGADALYMEKQITTRMEKELKLLKNLDSSHRKVVLAAVISLSHLNWIVMLK